ncbi:calmodulin-beta-like [Cylas formicarius]|uniref:calmodulin-beta-like n=1 Tax=Cylas formicarius TaxID=197179 RepID=UPI002958A013|nr:calmodulin-beta-like [Cylas formicarius]
MDVPATSPNIGNRITHTTKIVNQNPTSEQNEKPLNAVHQQSVISGTDSEAEYDTDKELLAEIKEVFSLFDKDGDGVITTKELGMVMKTLGQSPTEAELLDIVAEADKNKDGVINFDEFVCIMKGVMKECDNEDDIKAAFKVFDRNGKGHISSDDLQFIMTSLGEKVTDEECEEMITAADLDEDGQVSFADFLEMMISKNK